MKIFNVSIHGTHQNTGRTSIILQSNFSEDDIRNAYGMESTAEVTTASVEKLLTEDLVKGDVCFYKGNKGGIHTVKPAHYSSFFVLASEYF